MYIWIAKERMMLSNNNDANTQKNMWHKIFAPHIEYKDLLLSAEVVETNHIVFYTEAM